MLFVTTLASFTTVFSFYCYHTFTECASSLFALSFIFQFKL